MLGPALALLLAATVRAARQQPTECADDTMTLWMRNSAGKTPCALVQDVLRVCDASFEIGFLPRNYSCDNDPKSALAPCCCGSPTFALMSACWSCQYNITFDLVTTTFTSFEKACPPDPITSYNPSVQGAIDALDLPAWSRVEPLAGKWDMSCAWKNATPFPTAAPPVPTGYPITVTTGISKAALAGAIIGAILGSKLLFMLAGYLFWRWWRTQPGHPHEDDEKSYVERVLGEPRNHRLSRRRGSRSHLDLDLDEDHATPRSSRWLVPSYLKPTSFHSHSSESESPPPPDPEFNGQPGNVTPFEAREPVMESEKARTRRSMSMRVTNNLPGTGAGDVPRPQPALLAGARRLSIDSPQSPTAPLSHSNSFVVQNQSHSRSQSPGSGPGYQEDDAGVSLVIESGHTSPNPSEVAVRSVPPAYVDYRGMGYSYSARADKVPRFERRGSTSVEGTTSESATCIGSREGSGAGSVKAFAGVGVEEPGPSREGRGAVEERDEGEVRTVTERAVENGGLSAPRTPRPTGAESGNAARGGTAGNEAETRDTTTGDESDVRDRTGSGDSGGTVKPGVVEPPKPLERASTTNIAALSGVTVKRPSGP
ncbi:hypothetical protein FRC08_007339, partial [Ceratobasidium sp. 394]